jgi:hypothetical protein
LTVASGIGAQIKVEEAVLFAVHRIYGTMESNL